MARVLGVARSGFYAWRARQGKVTARAQAQHRLDARVAEAFAAAKGRSGAIRITKVLAKQGVVHNRKRLPKACVARGCAPSCQDGLHHPGGVVRVNHLPVNCYIKKPY